MPALFFRFLQPACQVCDGKGHGEVVRLRLGHGGKEVCRAGELVLGSRAKDQKESQAPPYLVPLRLQRARPPVRRLRLGQIPVGLGHAPEGQVRDGGRPAVHDVGLLLDKGLVASARRRPVLPTFMHVPHGQQGEGVHRLQVECSLSVHLRLVRLPLAAKDHRKLCLGGSVTLLFFHQCAEKRPGPFHVSAVAKANGPPVPFGPAPETVPAGRFQPFGGGLEVAVVHGQSGVDEVVLRPQGDAQRHQQQIGIGGFGRLGVGGRSSRRLRPAAQQGQPGFQQVKGLPLHPPPPHLTRPIDNLRPLGRIRLIQGRQHS